MHNYLTIIKIKLKIKILIKLIKKVVRKYKLIIINIKILY